MPRKPIGATAMTDAERQARYRVARAAGAPVIRTRRPADHPPPSRGRLRRARRWHDTVATLPSCRRSMLIGSTRCRPTYTTARWPTPSTLSAISISPNSRA